jgi:hypothetical protein
MFKANSPLVRAIVPLCFPAGLEPTHSMVDLVASTLKVVAVSVATAASAESVVSAFSFLQEVKESVVKTTKHKMIFFIVF